MKKIVAVFFVIGGIMTLLNLSGCKKVLDYVKHHPGGIADNCKITQLTDFWYYGDGDHIVYDTSDFVYNNYGDLLRINRRSQTNFDFIPPYFDQAFVYDNKHRVIAFIDGILSHDHTSNVGFTWHTYTYVGNSTIIDSVFDYPDGDYTVSFRPTSYNSVKVSTLTLDGWGRVVKDSYLGETYKYDTNGNLINPGVSYSNKTNIRQTNKAWMLIDRNYSINQPLGEAAQFNNNNLPVKFNSNFGLYVGGYNYGSSAIVTYSCK